MRDVEGSKGAATAAAAIVWDRAIAPQAVFIAVLLGLTLVRVAGLVLTPVDLHGDEAQYWVWSRSLDWGYFSKPPLIAWAIAFTTALFGDAEWAVRLTAPLAHALGSVALFLLASRMYGARAGLLAGLGWLTMPGVWLSSAIISTDALLLPIWAFALLALWRLAEGRSWGWAIALGAALGAGFLAKYAMSYFVLGAALAAVIDRRTRRALLSPQGALAGAIAAAIVTPNLAWNAAHDFATIGHTAANANAAAFGLHPEEGLQFLFDQLAVFGPLAFVALVLGVWRLLSRMPPPARPGSSPADRPARFLLAFIVPPLVFIAVQALLSRAHANWAAAAYPAAMVFVVGLWCGAAARGRLLLAGLAGLLGLAALGAAVEDASPLAARLMYVGAVVSAGVLAIGLGARLLWASIGLHAFVGLAFLALGLFPAVADAVGAADWFKRVRRWDETAALVASRARADDYTAIAVDQRLLYNGLAYYLRDEQGLPPLRMWVLGAQPENHAEASAPLTAAEGARVLVIGMAPPYEQALAADFAFATEPERIEQPLGGGEVRRLSIRRGEGFAPRPRGVAP